MQFPRSDVLRVVINAYIARRQPRWNSYYIEPLTRLTKLVTWQTYEGETSKKAKCEQLETLYLKPLEETPAQTDKWIELCCYLTRSITSNGSTLDSYFNFIRRFILLQFANQAEFKEALVKAIAKAKEASAPVAESKSESTALTELEQLQNELTSLDAAKTTAELTDFFVTDIRKYDASVKFANYPEFLAAALIEVPAKEIAKEVKPEPQPVKAVSTQTMVQKKLYAQALLDGLTKRVQEVQKKLEPPVTATEVKASPWDMVVKPQRDAEEKATMESRRPAPIQTHFEAPKMRRRNRSRHKRGDESTVSARPW